VPGSQVGQQPPHLHPRSAPPDGGRRSPALRAPSWKEALGTVQVNGQYAKRVKTLGGEFRTDRTWLHALPLIKFTYRS